MDSPLVKAENAGTKRSPEETNSTTFFFLVLEDGVEDGIQN